MKKCRIEKTFRMCDGGGSGLGRGRMVGGLYPEVKWDDRLFQMIGRADKSVPELAGLQPEGFVDGSEFDVMKFDFNKLAEIRETVLRYFTLINGYDCAGAGASFLSGVVHEGAAAAWGADSGYVVGGDSVQAVQVSGFAGDGGVCGGLG